MTVSQLLEELESRRRHVYSCSAGHPTIGVGHKLTREELRRGAVYIDGDWVPYANGLTDAQIDALLEQDIYSFESEVKRLVMVYLSENQLAALISFAFNVGVNALLGSTLLKLLNAGQYDAVPAQMRRWNKITVDGKKVVSKGLINRREKEVAVWEG